MKGSSSVKSQFCSLRGVVLAAIAVLGLAIAFPVQAQFVCGGSTTGAESQSGAGATATGSAVNFACGPNANASGLAATNVAVGAFANANGASGENVATGGFADAHGDNSHNVATGFLAAASGA